MILVKHGSFGRRVLTGAAMVGIVSVTTLLAVPAQASAEPTTPTISTFAGNGMPGSGGDQGAATNAQLAAPTGIAEDASGNVYIADTANQKIRRVSTAGIITTVAGNGIPGYSGDNGPATSASLNGPTGVAVDGGGNLYIADTLNNRIRKVNSAGIITTFAGNGGTCLLGGVAGLGSVVGPALNATLCLASDTLATLLQALLHTALPAHLVLPSGLAVDGSNNLYVADSGNNVIRKITPAGMISTFAGTGVPGSGGDGGSATSAQLWAPLGVAVDALGGVYIADSANSKVRKVSTGIITTFAGTGVAGFSGDNGPAKAGMLNLPSGTGVDPLGNVYITDTLNCRVRVVIPKGDIETYAGTGDCNYGGDGGPATAAKINLPTGNPAVDANNVFLGDTLNFRVRRIQGGPPPNIAEATYVILLPVTAALLLVAGYLGLRRRRQHRVSPPSLAW